MSQRRPGPGPGSALVGRASELAVIDRALSRVRSGLSSVLVLRGELGIGKSALLDYAVAGAGDMLVSWTSGVVSEMELGFAALHQLLVPFLGSLERLAEPQQRALRTVFAQEPGPTPDRFLVGLAALTLMTKAATERPVLCVVDDSHWVDLSSMEIFGFVARRLVADRVAMFFARPDDEDEEEGNPVRALDGLEELHLEGLPEDAARSLLQSSVGTIDPWVSSWLVAETAGNPLALIEFAGELSAEERSGVAPLTRPLRFGGDLGQLYAARARSLPLDARALVLVAAADELGDPVDVWAAAARLGADPAAIDLASVERVLRLEPRVGFRHPLMRSAAYYAATVAERRRAHEALAAVTDAAVDPDRRAWHRARAVVSPDEEVAAELEASARRAGERGGWASQAAFLSRAADLTPDAASRARRRLGAAEARVVAGEPRAAQALVELALPHLDDPFLNARARRLEGVIPLTHGRLAEPGHILLDAAALLEPHDPHLARATLLDAYWAACLSSEPARAAAEVVAAVNALVPVELSSPEDFAVEGVAALASGRYNAGAALLRRVNSALPLDGPAGPPVPDTLERLMAVVLANQVLLGDRSFGEELELRWAPELRGRGALAALVLALAALTYEELEAGRFEQAYITLSEGRSLAEATGHRGYLFAWFSAAELALLARRGREQESRSRAGELLEDFSAQGLGHGTRLVHQELAWLELGLGNYADALNHSSKAFQDGSVFTYGAPELVEAAVRCGERQAAASALRSFEPIAEASGTRVALGLLARCRALMAADRVAEAEYVRSIEHLEQGLLAPQLARSHLVYAEWLRRRKLRLEARDHLRAANQLFVRLGMAAFGARAQGELAATGEQGGAGVEEAAPKVLTPQESQIAHLAAMGLSNREIATNLFISPATVEYHLRKVFRKLGLTNRVQLVGLSRHLEGAPGEEE